MTARTKRAPRARKINEAKYREMLAEFLPRPIQTEAEYERAVEVINRLMSRPEASLSPEEHLLLELFTQLVEKYDDEHYAIPDAAPHEMIQYLMEDRGLRNKDLQPLLGSTGVTSEVINGKRKPSKTQIKALADFFHVAPEVFVSLD